MDMSADDERREFFRIRDRIPVEFRTISREEFIKLQDTIRYNSTQVVDRLHELYFIEARGEAPDENDHIYSYMQMINRKLDMIIEMLGKSQGSGNYISIHTDVIISGSGIQFIVHAAAFRRANLLSSRSLFPYFPIPRSRACARSCASKRRRETAAAGQKTAFKFVVINEKDQDILINYIFLKERQYLRQKKETAS